jgi:hypothetical protein
MVGFGMFVSRMQLVELGLLAAAYLAWTSWGWRRSWRATGARTGPGVKPIALTL